jgi:ribosome-interacting GTPase 1
MHNVIWKHKISIWQWIVDVYEKRRGQEEAAKMKFLRHVLNVTELITEIRISIIKHFKYLGVKGDKKLHHNYTEGTWLYCD